jgi:hypothetical protein
MLRKLVLIPITALAVAAMACGISINLPIDEIGTGPTISEELVVDRPDAEVVDLTLSFGAGELRLSPGEDSYLISGTAEYNVDDLKPTVTVDREHVNLRSGNLEISGIPNFGEELRNVWDLEIGNSPINLTINAGAYKADIELGGLSIEYLHIGDGAADVRLDFSEPNRKEMDSMRYMTGASKVELNGLANANFKSMIFRSGAGDYTLDFSGDLQRDAVVNVESGISQIVIIVPEGTPAQVNFEGGLANVVIHGDWSRSGDSYELEGEGPGLTINVDMGAGNLELRTR